MGLIPFFLAKIMCYSLTYYLFYIYWDIYDVSADVYIFGMWHSKRTHFVNYETFRRFVQLRSFAFASHPRSCTLATWLGASHLGTPCLRSSVPCRWSSAPQLGTVVVSTLKFVPIIPPNSSQLRSSCTRLTKVFPPNSSPALTSRQPTHSTELDSS